MSSFKIRAYSKTELGMLYAPNRAKHNAWRVVNNWIDHCVPLAQELKNSGLSLNARILSPRQVQIIVNYLGEP